MIGKTITIKSEYPIALTDEIDNRATHISAVKIQWDAPCTSVIEEFLKLLLLDGYDKVTITNAIKEIYDAQEEEPYI